MSGWVGIYSQISVTLKFPSMKYKAYREMFLYLFQPHMGGIKVVNSLEKAISEIADICFMTPQKPWGQMKKNYIKG